MRRACILQLLECGSNLTYCPHVRCICLDPTCPHSFLTLWSSQETLESLSQKFTRRKGSSFAHMSMYVPHAFPLFGIGTLVTYEDNEHSMKYDFHFFLQIHVGV